MSESRASLPRLSRRMFLGATACAVAGPALIGRATAQRSWQHDPFSLGVAAGSPSPDGFALWTRLAPEPQNYDPLAPAGLSGDTLTVDYEIATDPQMRSLVRRGNAVADARYAHSVHAEITGLQSGRSYWYRFISGNAVSRTGRAITAPQSGSRLDRLNFGFVSCSNYEHGYFSAYRHLANENPDLVIYLGDYIYEYVDMRSTNLVRRHSENVEADSLATYRNRYAQYRLDPDLQRLHAETTALMTWDDHEVQNDYADRWSQNFDDPEKFLQRRAAAYQAFYEHMPLRALSRPNGPAMRVYDRFQFGDLAEIFMIDGRQYRSREACYRPPDHGGAHAETNAGCPERLDQSRSMIGAAQEAWLFDGLANSRSRWNVIAQDVLMAQWRQKNDAGETAFWTDDWNGYPASRTRLLRHLGTRVANPVVLGGDIHSYWANDLKLDFDNPSSPTVATEFVGTSITSHSPDYNAFARFLPDNPHVRYFESRWHGYASVELEREKMTTRFRSVSDATDINAAVSTLRTFVVENGKPGAILA
jgi:alkaline phosphatase D